MFLRDQVLQGSGFSGSRFSKVRVRVHGPGCSVQSPGPASGVRARVRVQVLEVALRKKCSENVQQI